VVDGNAKEEFAVSGYDSRAIDHEELLIAVPRAALALCWTQARWSEASKSFDRGLVYGRWIRGSAASPFQKVSLKL